MEHKKVIEEQLAEVTAIRKHIAKEIQGITRKGTGGDAGQTILSLTTAYIEICKREAVLASSMAPDNAGAY